MQGRMIVSALDEVTSISVNICINDKCYQFHMLETYKGSKKINKFGKTIVSVEGKLYSIDRKIIASTLHQAILIDTCK